MRLNRSVHSDYRLARPLAIRVIGAGLVLTALLVMTSTVAVAAAGGGFGTLLLVAGVLVCLVLVGGLWVARGWAVLRLTEEGYRLRLWRSAGVRAARWSEVSEAAASYAGDEPVVVLQLHDGRRTVIPVRLLDVDRDELVRALQQHLQRGHGLRRL